MRSRQARGARSGSVVVRRVWRPGLAQRLAVLGGVLGSFVGLVLGLADAGRSLLGVLLLYLLGFLAGVVVGAAVGLPAQAVRATRHRGRVGGGRAPGQAPSSSTR